MIKLINFFIVTIMCLTSISCFSDNNQQISSNSSKQNNQFIEIDTFINSLKSKNKSDFITLISDDGVFVYRGFTSGNLSGARGLETKKVFYPKDITSTLTINLPKVTPIEFPWLFSYIGQSNSNSLAKYNADFQLTRDTPTSEIVSALKDIIGSKTESKKGEPFILKSKDGKFIALSVAQVIDDMLVGGIAIFKLKGNTFYLDIILDLR